MKVIVLSLKLDKQNLDRLKYRRNVLILGRYELQKIKCQTSTQTLKFDLPCLCIKFQGKTNNKDIVINIRPFFSQLWTLEFAVMEIITTSAKNDKLII